MSQKPNSIDCTVQSKLNSEGASSGDRLKKILNDALCLKASNRTKRYFLRDSDYGETLNKVVDTIEALRATNSKSIETEEGDLCDVSSYNVPKALKDYINTGRVYYSADAANYKQPIFRVPDCKAKLTSSEFNKFFSCYNENQPEDGKLPLVTSLVKSEITCLDNLQYVDDGKGSFVKRAESGYDLETCSLTGFTISGISDYCRCYPEPSKQDYSLWLFSLRE